MTGIGNKRQEGVAPRDALGWAIAPGDVVVYPSGDRSPVTLRLTVEEVRDDEAWAEACEREEEMKTTLQGFAREQKKRWEGA